MLYDEPVEIIFTREPLRTWNSLLVAVVKFKHFSSHALHLEYVTRTELFFRPYLNSLTIVLTRLACSISLPFTFPPHHLHQSQIKLLPLSSLRFIRSAANLEPPFDTLSYIPSSDIPQHISLFSAQIFPLSNHL